MGFTPFNPSDGLRHQPVDAPANGEVADRKFSGEPREPLDGASGPPDAPFLPANTLDTGIRLDSNTCSGGPGEVRYGEVNAYPGNTRVVSRIGWNSVG
jgi:hypothetical protein